MSRWFRGVCWAVMTLCVLIVLTGCQKREHQRIQVREEQHEGEVHEDAPGEMMVE